MWAMLRPVDLTLADNWVRPLVESHGFWVAFVVSAVGVLVAVVVARTVRVYVGFGIVAALAAVVGVRAQ
jgi:hypothetical protein